MGRPKNPEPSVMVSFRIPESMRNCLDVLAHYHGVNRSQLLQAMTVNTVCAAQADPEMWELMVTDYIDYLQEHPAPLTPSDFIPK